MEGSAAASTAASKAVVAWARRQNTARLSDMPALLSEVNAAVGKALRKKGQGGATTLACALVSRDGCVVATVGDSEVLAVDYSGPACRLNQLDHLPARPNMLLAWIDGDVEVEPHLIELETLPHRLCLVTDGVSQAVDGQRLANLLRDAPPSKAAEVLVIEALSGGATDDVTALVLAPRVLLNSSRSAVSE